MRKKILIIIFVIVGVLIVGVIIWKYRVTLPPMGLYPFEPCDLNEDNKCDLTDFNIIQDSMDSCAGDANFNTRADFDGSGCVTLDDYNYLLSSFPEDFNVSAEYTVNED